MDFFSDLVDLETDYFESYNYVKETPQTIVSTFSSGKEERFKEFQDYIKEYHDNVMNHEIKKETPPLPTLVQITPENMEAFYAFAYDFFQNGNFVKALDIFRVLFLLNNTEFRFIYGLSCTLQNMEYYMLAIRGFEIATAIEPENPSPSYKSSECFRSIGDDYSELLFLERAMNISGDKKEYEEIKTRSYLEFNAILLKNMETVAI